MPVQTRSEKRPADKAPETDDSVNRKKPASGIHGSAHASAKKKEQQLRWKSTERRRASPKKQAAVRAQDAAQHQARRANLPDEDRAAVRAENAAQQQARRANMSEEERAAEEARNAAQHQARRANLPDEDRDAVRARDAAQHAARVAAMPLAEQHAFHAREAERETQRVANLPENQRVTRLMAKQQAEAHRLAIMSEEERAAVRARDAAQHAARVAAMPLAEQQAFHAREAEREARRVAELPENQRVTRQMAKQQADARRRANLPEEERAAELARNAAQHQARREAAAQAPEAVNEAIRQGKPTCDINQHLEYCTQGGSTPGRHGAQDILDEMAEYSTTFEERWEQAKQYETKMRERMFDTRPCACCGIRVPETTMQMDIREGPESPLNLLFSEETDEQPNPTRVKLENGAQDYVLHGSYAGKPTVSLCTPCHRDLTRSPNPRLPRLCLKTVDVGSWPKGRLLGEQGDVVDLPPLSVLERLVVSPVQHSRYLTTAYDQRTHQTRSVSLSGHITAFSKPTPKQLDEALQQHFPASVAETGHLVQLVLVTADSKEAALEKARHIEELKVNGRLVHLWSQHIATAWEKLDIPFLQASIPVPRSTYAYVSWIILILRMKPNAFARNSTLPRATIEFCPKRFRYIRISFCALLVLHSSSGRGFRSYDKLAGH